MSPEEQAIVSSIDSANAQALALLQQVVDINSGSMNFDGVRAVGKVFRTELETLGFTEVSRCQSGKAEVRNSVRNSGLGLALAENARSKIWLISSER